MNRNKIEESYKAMISNCGKLPIRLIFILILFGSFLNASTSLFNIFPLVVFRQFYFSIFASSMSSINLYTIQELCALDNFRLLTLSYLINEQYSDNFITLSTMPHFFSVPNRSKTFITTFSEFPHLK